MGRCIGVQAMQECIAKVVRSSVQDESALSLAADLPPEWWDVKGISYLVSLVCAVTSVLLRKSLLLTLSASRRP